MASMRRFFALVLLAAVVLLQAPAHAQPRQYNQAELDALLAPVALYPDALLSQILVAATYPDDLREAAAWSRANPHLSGDDALRAAEPMLWPPSVKALVAFPDLLARMDESPQWTADLGAAFLMQEPQVMDTVQALRRRAQASGALQSNEHQQVLRQGQAVVVQPMHTQIVYVPYYNPYVVYGPWWWHAHHPVLWRPWHPRPAVFVSARFIHGSVDWHRRHVTRVHVHNHDHHHAPSLAHRHEQRVTPMRQTTVHNHVHQAQSAKPIVQGAQLPQRFERHEHRLEHRREHRREHRPEPRREHRPEGREHKRNGRG